MNHKLLTTTATLVALSTTAFAETTPEVRPYVGFELGYQMADYKTDGNIKYADFLEENMLSLNPYVGFQLNEHFGVEVGYLQTQTGKKTTDASAALGTSGVDLNSELKISGFHADLVGRHELSEKLDLIGSVGMARLKADLTLKATSGSVSAEASDDETDTAYRAGVGAEYALTDNIGMRGMFRYMNVDFDGTADNIMSVGVGFNYKF